MYDIGDKILYPMHGAGIIEGIEEKEILGEIRMYYVLKVSWGEMKLMIPVDTCDAIGVRPIIMPENIQTVRDVLAAESSVMDNNWNRRYRDNMGKLKTGDVLNLSSGNVMRIERVKKLSAGEKRMLNNARQILQSEVMLAGGMDETSARAFVDEAV